MYTHHARVLSRHSDTDILKATLKSIGGHHLWNELKVYAVVKVLLPIHVQCLRLNIVYCTLYSDILHGNHFKEPQKFLNFTLNNFFICVGCQSLLHITSLLIHLIGQ